jgi:hypothetical protein
MARLRIQAGRVGAEVHPFVPADVLEKLDEAAKNIRKRTGGPFSRTDAAATILRLWAEGKLQARPEVAA